MRGRAPHLDRDRIAAFFVLPGSLRLVTRLLISWDIFVALYLDSFYRVVFAAVCATSAASGSAGTNGRFLILLVTALGAFASIAEIVPTRTRDHRGTPELACWRDDDRAVMGGGAHHLRVCTTRTNSIAAPSPADSLFQKPRG